MYNHIVDLLKTPALIKLRDNLSFARFEFLKVHSTLTAIEQLLAAKTIKPGDTLLDSSSGIYAYSLALACHRYGIKCRIVASRTVDKALLVQLKILGVEVEQVQSGGNLKMDQSRRIERIKEILASESGVYWMQQYHDAIHYNGYEPFAQKLAEEFDGKAVTIVGGVGSGCSTGGIARGLRDSGCPAELIGVQPFGSVTFASQQIEDPGIIVAGIGSAIPFENVRHTLYDQIHWVSFEYGMSATVALLERHAIFAGLSSGCGYLVACAEARNHPDRQYIIIGADTGHRYVDDVYSRHADALDIDALAPAEITTASEMSLPWSFSHWNRRELSQFK
jgi:cysteine synthase A